LPYLGNFFRGIREKGWEYNDDPGQGYSKETLAGLG